ncbi:hypothetical protein R6Q57_024414 [Mikania cordata]
MVATMGIMDHVFMAACEWFLIFWMFVEAALAYSLTKFAKYCQLQIPCFFCSRLDNFFGNEKSVSYSHLFCNKHLIDVSFLIYCHLHDELADAREMCEDCANSANLQTGSNLECYRFGGGQMGKGRSYVNNNFVYDPCSCCKSQWKEKSTNQQPIWSNVVDSRVSKATAKPPLPRVGRHGRSKRLRNKVKHRHRNELSPVGQYSGVKFTSDSEFDFVYSDSDDGGFKLLGISEGSLKKDMNGVNPYRILGRHSHSTPNLRSAFLLEAQLNENSRTRTSMRSASLTPDCIIRCNMTELNKKPEEFDPLRIGNDKYRLSSMNHRGSLDGSMFSSSNNGSQNRYNIFSRNSYSASDLGSAIRLEMHNNNSSRQRSASLTPNFSSGHGLGEHQWLKIVPSKVKKHKKTNGYGYLDDSAVSRNTGNHHNRNKIPRRHSYSVFQLGGQILLNMPIDESQNGSFGGGGLEDFNKSKTCSPESDFHNLMQCPQKDDQDYIPYSFIRGDLHLPFAYINKNKGYGCLDDSVVTRNTGVQYLHTTPRRHSHSFFNLGSEILLNMPINESFTTSSASFLPSGSIGYGLEQPNNFKFQTRPNSSVDFGQIPRRKNKKSKKSFGSSNRTSGYESLDDLVGSLHMSVHDRNKDPRRHSYSAFELGGALPSNVQPFDRSLTNNSTSMTRNGATNHGFEKPKILGFQKRDNSSHSAMFLNKNQGYGFIDDSVVSFHTGIHDRNKDPRRHSYSAFELGCELLNTQPVDESSSNRSASVTRKPGSKTRQNASQPVMFLNKNQGYEFLDDSVVSFNTGLHARNKDPRRHSYSVFELGCAVPSNAQPIDKSLASSSASVTQNGAINYGFAEPKNSGFHTGHNPSHSIIFLNKNQGYGFLDDSVVAHNTGIDNHNHHHNQSKIPRRHSYSILQLGGDILLNMPMDEGLTSHSLPLAPNNSAGQSSRDPQKSDLQNIKNDKFLPPMGSVNRFSPSYDAISDLAIDKTKWHGSFDDYLILRSMGSQSNVPRRHSHNAFDLGRALLLEINLDNSSKNFQASMARNGSTRHGSEEHNGAHHHKAKRNKNHFPPPCPTVPLGSSSDFRNDLLKVSLDKTHGVGSLDDSFFSHKKGNHIQNDDSNPRRHSYSAFELGCALLLNMQCDASLTRRSASVTPKTIEESQHLEFKKDEQPLASVNTMGSDLSSNSLYKPHGHQSFDDYFVSNSRDDRKGSHILTRSYYSVSDLTSPVALQMNLVENFTRKSASLTPECSLGQGFGELKSLKFQSGTTSFVQKRKKNTRLKAKRSKRSKAKRIKKPLRKANNVKLKSSSTNAANDLSYESFDDSDAYESFDDSDTYESTTDSQNRNNIFSRNSQSASDLGSLVIQEMRTEDRSRKRSKSLIPNCSYFRDSIDPMQFLVTKCEEKSPTEVDNVKKQLQTNPTKEIDSSSTIKADLCPNCVDKFDLRSLDGSIASEIDYDGGVAKVKQQAEDDVRCMRLLQSELEAERNAATVAANHAMNMITRLQQEKASLQMEALQYLRMMEEQAEYDMEALQKANELVEEKESEIQDLLNELEQCRSKYDGESMSNIKSFDEERTYILESLSTLEKKINQLSDGVHDQSQENEKHDEFLKLEHEISDMKEKMEALQADIDLIKHTCNTLHSNEGLEFVQEIAQQLQDLRRIMFDKRLVSSN